ncbi:MAG: 6-phospho-beta-glucosidase [Deltaproteobacteria bacterium]|nr:6-phospho-beta-glucosidase [Deltaproteobacteria bacterium]
MKIAVIGGGSTYTPELLDGLIERRVALGLGAVVLHDIDASRLEAVSGFCERMAAHRGAPALVRSTLDRGDALDGADFVINQVRVGGQQARHADIQLCLEFDLIGQETTGMGGFAKALRTIPVTLDLCRAMERVCPNAWLLNFTNPSGLVTEAILDHGHPKAIGLCNVPMDAKMALATHLAVEPRQIDLDYVGLNHLSWLRRVTVEGRDVTSAVLDALAGGTPANLPDLIDPPHLVRAVGGFPLYYLRFFYHRQAMLAGLKAAPRSRAQEVMEIEERLLAIYRDSSRHEKPDALSERGGAYYSVVAVELVEAIALDLGNEQVVNVRNEGAIPNVEPKAVVEIPSRIGRTRVIPRPTTPLSPAQLGLLQAVKSYEQLTIQASVERSRDAAIAAMLVHPLGPDADRVEALLDRIIAKDCIELA